MSTASVIAELIFKSFVYTLLFYLVVYAAIRYEAKSIRKSERNQPSSKTEERSTQCNKEGEAMISTHEYHPKAL